MRRPRCHRALLVLALQCGLAAAKKRKQPAVPAELLSGCPFHREKATPDELSEFGHELERDGRKLEAERCYARAIRSSPQAATGWFDLAAARQYSDQSAAIRYYRHGLKLRPSGEPAFRTHPSGQPRTPCATPPRPYRAAAQASSTTSSAWSCGRRRGGRTGAGGATEPPGSATATAGRRHSRGHRHRRPRPRPRPSRRSAVGAPRQGEAALLSSSRRAGMRRRRGSSARPRGCSRPMRTRSSTWEAATSCSSSRLRRCTRTGVRRTRRAWAGERLGERGRGGWAAAAGLDGRGGAGTGRARARARAERGSYHRPYPEPSPNTEQARSSARGRTRHGSTTTSARC